MINNEITDYSTEMCDILHQNLYMYQMQPTKVPATTATDTIQTVEPQAEKENKIPQDAVTDPTVSIPTRVLKKLFAHVHMQEEQLEEMKHQIKEVSRNADIGKNYVRKIEMDKKIHERNILARRQAKNNEPDKPLSVVAELNDQNLLNFNQLGKNKVLGTDRALSSGGRSGVTTDEENNDHSQYLTAAKEYAQQYGITITQACHDLQYNVRNGKILPQSNSPQQSGQSSYSCTIIESVRRTQRDSNHDRDNPKHRGI